MKKSTLWGIVTFFIVGSMISGLMNDGWILAIFLTFAAIYSYVQYSDALAEERRPKNKK